ncbi:unnamed protein product [Alopecurus aequalis]
MQRPSASATASRFAAHWVADALAADDALDFSSVMALLHASPESLSGAPDSVTERVRTSGSLKKDMLPAFSQNIQNIICIKKPRLPATCFELLRGVDQEIACMALPSTVEQSGDNEHDRVNMEEFRFPTSTVEQSGDNEHDRVNMEELRFPTDSAVHRVENLTKFSRTSKENIFKESVEPTSVLQQQCISDTIIPRVDSKKTHLSSPQHDSGEKANQDLDFEGTEIKPVEKDSIPAELALRAGSILLSVRCNGAIQGDKSETNHLVGNSKKHAVLYEQPNDCNCHLEVCCANKVNKSLFSDGSILEKNMAVGGGLNVQSASGPLSCSVSLHDKISEDNYLSGQNNAKRTTDVQKLSCSITVPVPPRNGDGRKAKQISMKEALANTVVEISHLHSPDDSLSVFADKLSFCIKDRGTNSSPRRCSEKDLCIKCGKDDQLLKCNSCLLVAHESCFGPSVTFEEPGEFCCPVCFYTKATEAYKEAKKTYCEAKKNLAAFVGIQRLVNQHDEQPPEVLPRGPSNLNGYNSLTRKNIHQTETRRLACSDEKDNQQRKKQKINAPVDACPEEAVTGKAPSVRNSVVEPMNKHSVLQNISKKVHDAEKEHQLETTKSREEARNENSCDRTGNASHEKCGPSAINQEVEADKEDGLTNLNQSENSGGMEATSLNDSGQRSLHPLHNIRHHKARSQERETPVSCNSGKAFVHQGENMPSPSRKRNYAYPINRFSGPVAPTGRRSKLSWTDEEEAALRVYSAGNGWSYSFEL